MTSVRRGEADGASKGFEAFHRAVEQRLRQALTARYGAELGREATADALAWAWEHWERVGELQDPAAYLYRVGQSRARRRRPRLFWERPTWSEPHVEPELVRALQCLTARQRVVVVLVIAYEWRVTEVAQLFDLKPTTVHTHLDRGLKSLRDRLGLEES